LSAAARRVAGGCLSLVSRHAGVDAPLARTWATRGMAMWVLVILASYLLLFYT
jgi:hypothetical protein